MATVKKSAAKKAATALEVAPIAVLVKKAASKKAVPATADAVPPAIAKQAVAKKTAPTKKIAPAAHTTLNPNANWPFPTGTKP